jgi:beta-galactosidase
MANKAGWSRGPAKGNFDDSDWRTVDLPHDWSVEGPIDRKNYLDNGFLPRGVGWYRRYFQLEESDRGKYLALQFDGVATHCTVYVNGHLLHRNFCGYTPFTIDISDVANFGEQQLNVIAVFVDATPIEGWWYEGAGIYRHVRLIKDNPYYVTPDGIFVQPERLDSGEWKTWLSVAVANQTDQVVNAEMVAEVFDPSGVQVGRHTHPSHGQPRSTGIECTGLTLEAPPRLWSLDQPNLYTLRVRLGESVSEIRYGYRTIRFDADNGLFLNDQPLKLLGTCNHQDHAGVGAAVPDSIQEFRIRRLKEMGCNAIRCAHNPPAKGLLDACDRLGMLVMDENRNFGSSPEHFAQLKAMVERDRNHPSVFCWSLCNEEAIQGTPAAHRITRAMQHFVKQLDPSRPVTAAVSGGIINDDSTADAIEVMGINYQLPLHDSYHAKHPNVPLIAAETHCVLSTRGTYRTDPEEFVFASYDTETAPWGATARQTWRDVSSRPFIAGLFIWTGFDYRGEPSPHGWPCVNSHFGLMDTCGFAKDSFHLHKAYFTGRSGEPFVHLLPHWNWPAEGEPIRVMTYSNCDEAELFLNGQSFGRKPVDPIEMAEWSVPYQRGQLKAIGIREGKPVAEAIAETTGPATALGLEIHSSFDAREIPADGHFALPITVFALDDQGWRVPDASPRAEFSVVGPAKIIGVGNGDPTCHEPDKASARSLFRGLAQVIVQTTTTAGAIRLSASSPGVRPATLEFQSAPDRFPMSLPPATLRHFITDWRMSPITPDRPDPNQEIADQDMNSWERIDPARGLQAAWQHAGGYALYRSAFTPPRIVQTRGGTITLPIRNAESAEVYLDGKPIAATSVILEPAGGQRVLSVLVRASLADAGLVGPVEIIPR